MILFIFYYLGTLVISCLLLFFLGFIVYLISHSMTGYWPSSIWYWRDVAVYPDWYLIRPWGWSWPGWSYHDIWIYWQTEPVSWSEYCLRANLSHWTCISASRSALRERSEGEDWLQEDFEPWPLDYVQKARTNMKIMAKRESLCDSDKWSQDLIRDPVQVYESQYRYPWVYWSCWNWLEYWMILKLGQIWHSWGKLWIPELKKQIKPRSN